MPGGLAPLLSSVVMNVVPAQIAGVESIAVASPPQRDHGGLPDPGVLAACALLGVTEVYAVGGAQAIAVFGYGAGSCEPVDMVTGPGNVYVTAAKRLLRGLIGIDSEAGPTEVAILADDTADPAHVAADLISQAEHDPLAGAVLVTDSEALADAVLEPGARAGGGDQALRPDHHGARRQPVRRRPGRRRRRGAAGRRRLRRRAPGDPDPRRPRGGGAGAQRRRDLRRAVVAGLAGRLLRRLQPRAAHRRVRPALQRPVACSRSCAASTSSSTTSRRSPTSPGTSTPSPAPRTCPAHAAAVRGSGSGRDALDELPLRPELRGRTPYGAPQLPATYRLNTNENPHPLPDELLADLGDGARARGAGAQPLPRPGRRRAARRPGRLPVPAGGERSTPAQVWAANGSNEVLQQILQAFGGAGPDGAGLHAVVLDAPDHHRRHRHRLGRRAPPRATSRSTPRPRRRRCARSGRTSSS